MFNSSKTDFNLSSRRNSNTIDITDESMTPGAINLQEILARALVIGIARSISGYQELPSTP